MPRKKATRQGLSKTGVLFQSSKSYRSLLYGVLTVFIVFVVLLVGVRFAAHQKRTTSIGNEGITTMFNSPSVRSYTVKEGDSLWSIAVTEYNNGYNWVEIAKANNLSNPGQIDVGMKLVIPVVSPTVAPTITQEPVATITPVSAQPAVVSENKITGNSYAVVRGDNLWDIAVRAYGDGYRWVDIARVNHLANPDLIHAGNQFILPR